jgi:octaprenyl-diphosphate synthase
VKLAVIVPFESPGSGSIERLNDLVAGDMERVNATILARTGSDVTMIPEVANHLIASGGKRLRPMLTLAMAKLSGYSGDGHIKLAAAVEFMHTATLLHDDVVDESDMRRGKLAARMLWGNEASVLVGDFLYSRAFEMMVDIGVMRVMDVLSHATNRIAEGEVLQLLNTNDPDTDERRYMEVIERKTATLFEAGTRLGAVLAEVPRDVEDSVASFGKHLGVAFQLVDDALDYDSDAETIGKHIGDDLEEGKPTLPVIRAMEVGNDDDRRRLRMAIETGGREHIDDVVAAIVSSGAIEYTIALAQRHAAAAKEALEPLPPSPARAAMEATADFAVARTH